MRHTAGVSAPSPVPSPTRGRLLVATPPLADPHFDRTVVFMLEHRPDGALGVVLNRPEPRPSPNGAPGDAAGGDPRGEAVTDIDDPGAPDADDDEITAAFDGLDHWRPLLAPPATLFRGGPVGTSSLIAIAEGRAADGSVWGSIDDRLGAIDLALDPDEAPVAIERLRIFRGYSGWGPGQLDGELAGGAWMVFDAEPGDVFTPRPHELWRLVVRRQGGRLRWIADAPDDIAAN